MDDKTAWRFRTREWATALLGGQCAKCGCTTGLQFDHIDYRSKSFEISVGIRDGYSRTRLEAELTKCQLLCGPHHREKNRSEGSTAGGRNKVLDPEHGTAVMYGRANRCRCQKCKIWKRLYRAGLVDSLGHPCALVV